VKEGKMPTGQSLADIVRGKSKAGQLVAAEELLQGLKSENPETAIESDNAISRRAMLNSMTAENRDVREICAKSGTSFYYSSMFMSESYARILLHKQEGAAELIANTVREDSDRYPRPTPLDVFKEPPFDLGQEELLSCLQEMSEQEQFGDISQVSTSMGHVFLYSSRYLDRDYAQMLSEWMDVGQFENP
jgi:hypothetical protein